MEKLRNTIGILDIRKIKFETGDIIFTRHDYMAQYELLHYACLNLGQYYLSGKPYTYAAMIIYKDNTPYIYQVGYLPHYDHFTKTYRWKAPMLMNLEEYLMQYGGEIFFYKYLGNAIDSDKAYKLADNYSNIRETTANQILWANSILESPLIVSDKNKVFCSQLIAQMLTDLSVITINKPFQYIDVAELENHIIESKKYGKLNLIYTTYLAHKKFGEYSMKY